TLAHKRGGRKQLVAMLEQSSGVAARFDVNETGVLQSIRDAFGTLLAQEPRTILVTGKPPGSDEVIELVALEEPLRNAMLIYTRNVLILSLIISCLTAAMVYFTLTLFFVRPVRRMAENMVAFSEYPEATDSIIKPTGRSDEIGVAEERLAAMQADLQGTLSSQKRLASLGLAMSKVNHDLRNILASVQLFSDRLATVSDPDVQRFAPKLMRGIDHAISYCQATLVYGSASNEPPEKRVVRLAAKVDEIAGLLNLEENTEIEWVNSVPPDTEVEVDPEQIFRVLMNLARNAIKAMESLEGDGIVRRLEISSDRLPDRTRIYVIDTGPGVPEKAKTHLFEAFRGSVSHGGVGLGLAIASEFVRGHGGKIRLADDGRTGATFEVDIPHPGKTLT
ncbi:MAG: HAMP domain-containing sensor histidine kinase, partial [Pseudomonadota bacterium]